MRKPSITTIIACLALFFSVAGTALAASRYLITSTSQIKPSVRRALEGQQGPQGQQGPAGAQGVQGLPGAAGVSFTTSDVTVVTGPVASMCASGGGTCATGSSVATCPAGDVVLGGGWTGPLVDTTIAYSYPIGSGAWDVIASNDSVLAETMTAYAVCGS